MIGLLRTHFGNGRWCNQYPSQGTLSESSSLVKLGERIKRIWGGFAVFGGGH